MPWKGLSALQCPNMWSNTHKVVKFIVNVKLMEKMLNKHVGRVIVQKAMVHSRACGRNVTSDVKAYTKPPPDDCPWAIVLVAEAIIIAIELRLVGVLKARLDVKGGEDARPAIEETESHEDQALLLQLLAESELLRRGFGARWG